MDLKPSGRDAVATKISAMEMVIVTCVEIAAYALKASAQMRIYLIDERNRAIVPAVYVQQAPLSRTSNPR